MGKLTNDNSRTLVSILVSLVIVALAFMIWSHVLPAEASVSAGVGGHCGERFSYEAILQGVSVVPGRNPVVQFPDCPELTMPITFTGEDIQEPSWTSVYVEGEGLVPAMAATIREGAGAINFGQQIIPNLIVAVSPTTDLALQALLESAFAEGTTQTVFVGAMKYGFEEDGAGGIQTFAIWIDVQEVDTRIPQQYRGPSVDSDIIPEGYDGDSDCKIELFTESFRGGDEEAEARAEVRAIDVSSGVIFRPLDTLMIPTGAQREFIVELRIGKRKVVRYPLLLSCPGL